MANDIYFRTSIAGYNKQDVMRFIEKLNCEQTERMNDLNDRNRTLQVDLKKITEELALLREKYELLDEKLRNAELLAEENLDKASKYDEMQASYADLMLNAEHEAQKKIAQAEEEALRITESARAEIERRERELEAIKIELGDSFAVNKEIIERSREEFSSVFEKICSSVDTVYSKIINACKKAGGSDDETV